MTQEQLFSRRAQRMFFILLMCMSCIAPLLIAQEEDGEESGEEILARERYFYERRAGGPGMTVPEDAYARSVAERDRLVESLKGSNTALAGGNWVSVNPAGMFYARTGSNYISGRTNSIAFYPPNPSIMYAGAAGGGVWKTVDGGVQWNVLSDNLTAVTCGAVAVDPGNPNIVYFGTGELNFSLDSYYGDGIFKTTDGGTSWTKIATTTVGRYFSQIAINPLNNNTIYISGSSGIYKSTNAGASWTTTSSGNNANCVLLDPTNPEVVYTTTGGAGTNVVRKSTNGGTSWSTLGGGLPTSSVGRTQLALAPSNPSVLYASVANSGTNGLLGLYRTTDAGATWTLQSSSPNYMSGQGWYDNAVTVHPTNPNMVIVGGLDIYVSTNAGVTLVQRTNWSTTGSSNMSHADIHFLGYNNGVLFCGSDGGVYKSANDGVTWSDLNATLSTLQFQGADYDPNEPERLYGGTQDNNLETSSDGGNLWIQRTTGDGGYSVVDPVTPNFVYGQYVQGSLKRSNDYGVNFTEIGPSGSTGGLFYNPYEMAPSDHNIVVYGQSDVWKTTSVQTATSSSGWTQIATAGIVGGSVASIAISNDPNKIYIGTSNSRILVTTNNGSSWLTRTGFQYVSDLFVDNLNDNVCYAGCAGTTAGSHVFKTVDGGTTWTNITGNLPNTPVNTLVVRTATPRMIFVGTDIGVFQSTNEGASWVPFNNGFPALPVFDLKYKDLPNILLAATHGRGCFMYTQLPPIRITVSSSSIDFGLVEAGHASDTVAVTLQNRGIDTLIVSSISNQLSAFHLVNLPALPAHVPGPGSIDFKVTAQLSAHGLLVDTVKIVSDDPDNPTVRVALKAKGIVIGQAQVGVLYAASATQTDSSRMYRVNTTNAALTPIGATGITELDGLAVRPSTGEIYGAFTTGIATSIYRLSEQHGDALPYLNLSIPNLRAIAFNSSDVLFAATTAGRLYRINVNTGDTTFVGSSGLAYSGLSFNPTSGELWASVRTVLSNRDRIYKVNTTTGAATLIGGTGDNAITPSIAFDRLGVLYGLKGSAAQTNTLIRIDTTTAAGTTIGSTGIAGLLAIAMRTDSVLTGVEENPGPNVPAKYALHQNYPNPFNPVTQIRYDLPAAAHVKLTVFDVLGKEIATLVEEVQQPGYKSVQFNSNRFASGVYFYRLTAGSFVATKKMLVVK